MARRWRGWAQPSQKSVRNNREEEKPSIWGGFFRNCPQITRIGAEGIKSLFEIILKYGGNVLFFSILRFSRLADLAKSFVFCVIRAICGGKKHVTQMIFKTKK
jgi:hypothetical protein